MKFSCLLGPLLGLMLCAAAPAPLAVQSPPPASGISEGAGVKLHYLDFGGSGTNLVLIPGAGGSAWVYSDFGRELAKERRVVAMTRRGHGQSERPDKGYGMDALVGDILAFLDAQKIDRAVLFGHSLAGEELTRFAAAHPDRVAALVYLDAAYDRSIQGAVMEQDPVPGLEPTDADRKSVNAYRAYWHKSRTDLIRFWSTPLDRDFEAGVGKRADGSIGWLVQPMFGEYWMGASAAAPDYTKIKVPALAIYAAEDESYRLARDATPQQKKALADYLAGPMKQWRDTSIAQFRSNMRQGEVVTMDADHHMFLQQPEKTLRLVDDFLDRHAL